jgi:glycosyltransferase involved in cell wall biosynthesis
MVRPFVSILIDTYNHERFVEEAVSSALAQDYPASDREILVVDDGSTDRTPEILAKFAPHIRILRKANGGQASAFNYAIPQCRGQIVSTLDGDDWWAPNKVSSAVAAFAEHPSAGIIGHSLIEVHSDGSKRTETILENPYFRADSPHGARLFRLRKSFLGTSRMSCRADLLRRILPVPESLVFQADEFIFTLAAFFSDVFILAEPLAFYRIHGQNLFSISGDNLSPARRKHEILVNLVAALRQRLARENIPSALSGVVLETIQNDADMLALCLDHGTPFKTIRTELRNYRIMYEHASPLRWFLKCLSLFPALFVSPARYVLLKQKVGANQVYRRAREKVFPFYRPTHVNYLDQKTPR